jgi:hypothetical protein
VAAIASECSCGQPQLPLAARAVDGPDVRVNVRAATDGRIWGRKKILAPLQDRAEHADTRSRTGKGQEAQRGRSANKPLKTASVAKWTAWNAARLEALIAPEGERITCYRPT